MKPLLTQEQRKERLRLSEGFLGDLLERIREGSLTGFEEIPGLYKAYCKENAHLVDTFDLGHVWSIAWQRDLQNGHIAEDNYKNLPLDAADVTVALGLLEQAVFENQGNES